MRGNTGWKKLEAFVMDRASWYSHFECTRTEGRQRKRVSALFVNRNDIKKSPQLPFSVVAGDVFKVVRKRGTGRIRTCLKCGEVRAAFF